MISVPLGALVSKSRRMTLSSCSSVSSVEKSSSGMTFEGNTMRPCRFRTKAFTSGASLSGGSAGRGGAPPPLAGARRARRLRLRPEAGTGGSSLSGGSAVRGALHPPLDGGDEAGPQLGGGDDVVHRAHPAGALDVVDGLELGGDLTELL